MSASQELLDHVNDPTIPDKARILRTRVLAGELTRDIENKQTGERMRRSLNDAYLNLQLATIADDAIMIGKCRADCVDLIREIARITSTMGNVATRH